MDQNQDRVRASRTAQESFTAGYHYGYSRKIWRTPIFLATWYTVGEEAGLKDFEQKKPCDPEGAFVRAVF
jgi:hypothetical protein